MGKYFAQVTLQAATGNAEDVNVNGLAVGGISELDQGFVDSWMGFIKDLYDDLRSGNALRGIAVGPHLVKFYDIDGGIPNYPKWEETFNLEAAGGAIELPMEVALAISYSNLLATTVPRGRRRGRIYISGWTESANDGGRPITANVNSTLAAFSNYVQAVNAIDELQAGIWSRANDQVYPIQEAHVDNEWDTMRSRGGKATSRASWLLP